MDGVDRVMKYKAKINEVVSKSISVAYVTDGVKKGKQPFYDSSSEYDGRNGSYVKRSDREYLGSMLVLKLYIHDLGKHISIDIRDYVLDKNNMRKVSSKLMDYIEVNNCNKNVYVIKNGAEWDLADYSQLDIVRPKKKVKTKK